MNWYRVMLEGKDYGEGPRMYRTYVQAETEYEAEQKAMSESKHCGIESADAFLIKDRP